MNYDETNIPAGYDRARDHGPENVELWMGVVSSYAEKSGVNTILDLGCGTGRYTAGLAARFEALAVGVDPSAKMLERALAKKPRWRVQYVLATAEAIPLRNDSIDLIFMSMVFHHFNDADQAARECRRILRNGGIAFLRAGTSERAASYPYVEFFPSSQALIEELLTTRAAMQQTFEAAGFRTVAADSITQMIAPSIAAFAEKLSARGDSILSQLPETEFEAGLDAIRRRAETSNHKAIYEPIDFFAFQ